MKLVLDGRRMTDKETLHQYLKEQLRFPDYYGCNLDALNDMLGEAEEPLELCLEYEQELLESLGDYGRAFVEVLQDASADNPMILFKRGE